MVTGKEFIKSLQGLDARAKGSAPSPNPGANAEPIGLTRSFRTVRAMTDVRCVDAGASGYEAGYSPKSGLVLGAAQAARQWLAAAGEASDRARFSRNTFMPAASGQG